MRRILCLLMALCLFPFAVFAESTPQPSAASSFLNRSLSAVGPISTATPMPTSLPPAPKASATPTPTEDASEKEPQPMDGMMFLHRLLFALDALNLESLCFNDEPSYLYSAETGDGYLKFGSLLFTFSHYERTFKLANAYYIDNDNTILDKCCQTLPAILFALSPIDVRDEYDAFYYQEGNSFLADYEDPAIAKNLILDARQTPQLLGDYYLTADQTTYQLSLRPNAESSYFKTDIYQAATKPGKDLYCLFIRYTIAKYYLGVLDYNHMPHPSFSPQGYACYTVGNHLEFFANRSTGLEQNPTYIHQNVFEQIPIDDLKDVYALYFALHNRPLHEEYNASSNNQLLKDFDDAAELRSLVEAYFAPGNIVGDYRMYTQHYTNKRAKTHTLFSAGVNYDK